MLKEFKEFAMKGNMLDLAIGVVIGAAFGKIIDSLVNDIIMPPLGALTSGVDFSSLKTEIRVAENGKAAVTLNWGNFVNQLVVFIIVAFALFLVVKAMNKLRRAEEQAPAPPKPEDVVLLAEIRDLLKSKS